MLRPHGVGGCCCRRTRRNSWWCRLRRRPPHVEIIGCWLSIAVHSECVCLPAAPYLARRVSMWGSTWGHGPAFLASRPLLAKSPGRWQARAQLGRCRSRARAALDPVRQSALFRLHRRRARWRHARHGRRKRTTTDSPCPTDLDAGGLSTKPRRPTRFAQHNPPPNHKGSTPSLTSYTPTHSLPSQQLNLR